MSCDPVGWLSSAIPEDRERWSGWEHVQIIQLDSKWDEQKKRENDFHNLDKLSGIQAKL